MNTGTLPTSAPSCCRRCGYQRFGAEGHCVKCGLRDQFRAAAAALAPKLPGTAAREVYRRQRRRTAALAQRKRPGSVPA